MTRSSLVELFGGDLRGAVDVFLVPPDFDLVEMHDLLVQQDIRANQYPRRDLVGRSV